MGPKFQAKRERATHGHGDQQLHLPKGDFFPSFTTPNANWWFFCESMMVLLLVAHEAMKCSSLNVN